jgi:hypothetical protein
MVTVNIKEEVLLMVSMLSAVQICHHTAQVMAQGPGAAVLKVRVMVLIADSC